VHSDSPLSQMHAAAQYLVLRRTITSVKIKSMRAHPPVLRVVGRVLERRLSGKLGRGQSLHSANYSLSGALRHDWRNTLERNMPNEMKTYETMTSDALERLARLLEISIDLDDPEPALIAAVERAVAELVISRRETRSLFVSEE